MPILIRGNGGAKEFATIKAKDTGEIIASTKKGTSHHWLSSNDDADFVAENIKSGVNIFGVDGSFKGYHHFVVDQIGKKTMTIRVDFKPKGIVLLPLTVEESYTGDAARGPILFAHLPEHDTVIYQLYSLSTEKYLSPQSRSIAEYTDVKVTYSENAVTVSLQDDRQVFLASFDAIVLG